MACAASMRMEVARMQRAELSVKTVRRFFRFFGLGACAGAFGCAIMFLRVSG